MPTGLLPPPAIVHVDQDLIAVDKPAGMLSVPGRGDERQDCVLARLRKAHPEALVVHRLDQATSGLLLFARGLQAQRTLSRLFEQREIGKHYVAEVWGEVEAADGVIDLPLAADWPNRPRQIVDAEQGRPSQTRWWRLCCGGGRSRLLLEPLTGRTHQLRVHCLAFGHAIVGDALYDPARPAPRMLLHATQLRLPGLTLESPCPF